MARPQTNSRDDARQPHVEIVVIEQALRVRQDVTRLAAELDAILQSLSNNGNNNHPGQGRALEDEVYKIFGTLKAFEDVLVSARMRIVGGLGGAMRGC
jgi:hypothetical protein